MEKITRFEKARLVSARALQIALGAPTLFKPHENMSILDIAKAELEQKVLPMAILRKLPSGEIKRVEVF
ncbi:MAG: DNA-directed RNA polymerase subunit K [Candidatus Diapherotrites archaeon]|nr:DNA-directed RNA polymerase subunit K [Candidatus Diapherotrites archaeon]